MPARLIGFLVSLVFLALFVGFNLENRCDVSLVFHTFRDVPVVISLLFAFVAGALSVIPALFGSRAKRKDAARRSAESLRASEPKNPRGTKKSRGVKKGSPRYAEDERSGPDPSDYGID